MKQIDLFGWVTHRPRKRERVYKYNPDKKYGPDRPHKLWSNQIMRDYGMTVDQYQTILAEQGGGCAICGGSPGEGRKCSRHLHVDHDHASGKVRGLLCHRCNAGLGFWDDREDLILEGSEYLERTAKAPAIPPRTKVDGRKRKVATP